MEKPKPRLQPLLYLSDGAGCSHSALLGEVIQYEVVGLPRGWQALVGKKNGHWRTLRVRDNVPETWCGQHATPEEALAALQAELDAAVHKD